MDEAGSISIEFTRTRTTERDKLPDYGALVDWGERAGVVTPTAARGLRKRAQAHPGDAARVHAASVDFRDSLYKVLEATSGNSAPDAKCMVTVNAAIRRAGAHRALERGSDGYAWTWSDDEASSLERVLWPIAQDAADLLTSDRLHRVGVCAADDCRWLFIDESRNHSRRWCDMSDCGTKDKVRRFRERQRRGRRAGSVSRGG
jgi:predicted RNA-binding Zn ribbon-like protein